MKIFIFAITAMLSGNLHSDTLLTSHFGFSVTTDDDWFILSPDNVAQANKKESLKSLGIPEDVDQVLSEEILEKIKSGNIEFYYDKRYMHKEYKNHISAQLSSPIIFKSAAELQTSMDQQCKSLPSELATIFGEAVTIHTCRSGQVNNRAILRHAYTVPSKNLIIVQDQIPVNSDYSIILVGGSGNDPTGLKRVQSTQLALVKTITEFLSNQIDSNNKK